MPISDGDARGIYEGIARLETEVRHLKEPGAECLLHTQALRDVAERMEKLDRRLAIVEAAAGKEKFVTAIIGAVAAGVILMVRYLLTTGATVAKH